MLLLLLLLLLLLCCCNAEQDCLESLERCESHLQKRAEVVQVQRLLHPLRHQLRNAAASNATAVADEVSLVAAASIHQ
jgi:hypothetical protein